MQPARIVLVFFLPAFLVGAVGAVASIYVGVGTRIAAFVFVAACAVLAWRAGERAAFSGGKLAVCSRWDAVALEMSAVACVLFMWLASGSLAVGAVMLALFTWAVLGLVSGETAKRGRRQRAAATEDGDRLSGLVVAAFCGCGCYVVGMSVLFLIGAG